jgi:DHA3 family macrolide efflux protein-like MFS transporter
LREALYGFKFILKRPSLLGLQLVFFAGNFLGTFMWTLMAPTILARTGDNTVVLGSVQSIASIGGILGGLLVTAWGGFKRKVRGVLLGWAMSGIFTFAFGLGRTLIPWAAAVFLLELSAMVINPSNQVIWQSKVPPDVQGRVFSVRRMIAQISAPLAMLIAGVLADQVFEPGMKTQGSLLNSVFSGIFGSGAGAGMGLLISITGLLTILVGLIPFGIPLIRNVETLLPDFKSNLEPAGKGEPSVQPENA